MSTEFTNRGGTLLKTLSVLLLVTVLPLSGCSAFGAQADELPAEGETVYFGVSGPLTGDKAEYGDLWRQGFDLALQEINDAGGIDGHPLALKWEDSQSDPKQTVPIAQKFVSDGTVIAELGDYTSPSSMAASPVYQRGGLVQFGFTNSHPDFTKAGDYIWSSSLTQPYLQGYNAEYVAKFAKSVAIIYQETDWGKTAFDIFSAAVADLGVQIVYESSFLTDSQDLSPILIKARDAKPDAVVHLGYGPDGALVVKQLREKVGYEGLFFGGQPIPQYLELAGQSAEGGRVNASFSTANPDPKVQEFVAKFREAYGTDPGDFNVYAYDALHILAQAAEAGGVTRQGIKDGLAKVQDFQTIQFGPVAFDPQTRRLRNASQLGLVVRDGAFTVDPEAPEEES
jgi:branched-chain amino acid transport system substrate-binding protein